MLLNMRTPLVGKVEDTAARRLFTQDQSLILKQLERRVDRSGARTPYTTTARCYLLDDFVAV